MTSTYDIREHCSDTSWIQSDRLPTTDELRIYSDAICSAPDIVFSLAES
jgi:hypothetical protein